MSRKSRVPRDPELFDVEAGRRMQAFFDRARVELGYTTDAELWRRLGVSRDTAQAWMRGERPPSRAVGTQVADKLGVRYDDLLAVYEGREGEDIDPATVIAALEWAIRLVRSGQVPAEVTEAVQAAERSARPRRQAGPSGGGAAPKGGRRARTRS